MQSYLKRRHNAWSVRVQIPRHLWGLAGRREYVKALGTSDLKEAERRKHHHVAEFKRRIAELERRGADPLRDLFQKALELREALDASRGEWIGPEGHEEPLDEFLLSEALDEAKGIVEQHGPEAARRFMSAVKGQATFLGDVFQGWLDETAPPPKRRDLHLVSIKAFLDWAGQNVTLEEVTRAKAGAFISFLLDGTRAKATINRYRSSLATLWRWLGENGLVDHERNPWLHHTSIRTAGKAKRGTTREGLNDAQLVKLLSTTYSGDGYRQAIADLTRLALVTGARLEELGDLRRADVEKQRDGFWLTIRKGKTEAAERKIPLHKSAKHIIQRRLGGKAEYVFSDLTPGPYGRRTHHVSKAYGRFRKQAGVSERGEDFHALRHTFTATLEGKGVPLSTIQLVVGHSRKKTMGTTAVYTKGERVNLRKTIETLRYSPAVMRLLVKEPRRPEAQRGA